MTIFVIAWSFGSMLFGLLFSVDLVYPLLVILLLVDVCFAQHVLTVTELCIIEGDLMSERCGPDSEPPKSPIVLPAISLSCRAQLTRSTVGASAATRFDSFAKHEHHIAIWHHQLRCHMMLLDPGYLEGSLHIDMRTQGTSERTVTVGALYSARLW
jgi:hypothetical protein